MKRIKKENGSVTVVVFSTVTFLLIIMAAIFTTMIYKRKSQAIELHDLKEVYESSMEEAYIERTSGFLTGNGSEEQPFGLYTIEDLVKLSNQTNSGNNFNGKFIKLTKTLDFLDDSCYENAYRTDYGDLNGNGQVEELKTELIEGNGFPCISQDEANAFSGTFLGNNEEIRNLYIHREDGEARIGFFANLGNSKIEGLGLTGEITSKTNNSLGGLTGAVVSGTTCEINNCHNKVNVSSEASGNSVGGFIGNMWGTLKISNSNNDGKISGSNNAGGLIGYMNGTVNIQNCSNKGEITNTLGDRIGGLIGSDDRKENNITIVSSYNDAKVTGKTDVGGLVGRSTGTIDATRCYNTGNVTSVLEEVGTTGIEVGGLLGRGYSDSTTKLKECYNQGTVESKANITQANVCVAGMIGRPHNKVEIISCHNDGRIINGSRAGGLIGETFGTASKPADVKIINSYNNGEVDATKMGAQSSTSNTYRGSAGGIARGIYHGTMVIINSYNLKEIKAYNGACGIAIGGTNSTFKILNCFNKGNVKSNNAAARGIINVESTGTRYISNVYNTGEVVGATSSYGIAYNDNGTLNISNTYFLNNVTNGTGGTGITTDPSTRMNTNEMKNESFVETLNTNKNNINLSTYNLADYTLSSWKSVTNGYPEFE